MTCACGRLQQGDLIRIVPVEQTVPERLLREAADRLWALGERDLADRLHAACARPHHKETP